MRRTFVALWLFGVLAVDGAASLTNNVKRIYIAPDDHTDLFWTANAADYSNAFVQVIDYYLDLMDATESEPPEHQAKWNCDGSFWMWVYEKTKSPAEFQRFIDRVADGHMTVPLNALCITVGGAPTEAVLRGMYYPGRIERQYGVRFPTVLAMENQTLPYGLASLWAGAGAKYSWKGICGCDTRVSNLDDRNQEIYWYTGPDDSKILMKWNSLIGGNPGVSRANESIGGYAEARNPYAIVDFVDLNPAFTSRYPYPVIGAFGEGWDDFTTMNSNFVDAARTKTTSNRLVLVSNETDFFEDFKANCAADLVEVACSFGNEWDLYCAAMAETSARVRRSVEKLHAGEALATLVALQDPSFLEGRTADREQAWMNLGLFWEHNFGMAGIGEPLLSERIAWQHALAAQVEGYVDSLCSDGVQALGAMIAKSGTNDRFFVFNPMSWTRTDYADAATANGGPVHVVDLATGLEVPHQIVQLGEGIRLRIQAPEVPSVGYKVFEIRPGAGTDFSANVTAAGDLIENSFLAVRMDASGAITSLVDKTRGNIELAKQIDGRWMNDLGGSGGTLQVTNAGPVSATLLATSSDPLQHTSSVTLYRDSDRVEIENRITEGFDGTYSWSFGFGLSLSPDVWHEELGAVIRARTQANGGDYADDHARYDWLTMNHFADVAGPLRGVTISNADCYFMRLGNSTVDQLDTVEPRVSILAGGRVGGSGSFGIRNQGGDTEFTQRFALRVHDEFSASAGMQFAMGHQNPFVTGMVSGGTHYPSTIYSFCRIDRAGVIITALKPHEDGIEAGIVVRVWNLNDEYAPVNLTFPYQSSAIQLLTHIETPDIMLPLGNPNRARVHVNGRQIRSFRIQFSDVLTDADRDGSPDVHEFQLGTDPEDHFSVLRWDSLEADPLGLTVSGTFSSVSGRTYQVQRSADPLQTGWADRGVAITASGAVQTVEDAVAPGTNLFMYRLRLAE